MNRRSLLKLLGGAAAGGSLTLMLSVPVNALAPVLPEVSGASTADYYVFGNYMMRWHPYQTYPDRVELVGKWTAIPLNLHEEPWRQFWVTFCIEHSPDYFLTYQDWEKGANCSKEWARTSMEGTLKQYIETGLPIGSDGQIGRATVKKQLKLGWVPKKNVNPYLPK